jgi:WD40 repeat protein
MPKRDAIPLSWSCNSKLVLVSVKKKLLILDSDNGNIVREIPVPKGQVSFARLSSDKNLLIHDICYDDSRHLQVIRLDTSEILYEKILLNDYEINNRQSIKFLNNETVFAVINHDIFIIDINGFKEVKQIGGHEGSIEGFVMIPPMEKEMIISDNKTIRIIDLKSGKETRCFEEETLILNILSEKTIISPDGTTILLNHEDGIGIYDIPSRKLVKKLLGHVFLPGVSPDFSMIVTEKDCIRTVYRISDGEKLYHLQGVKGSSPMNVSFSADSRLILMSDWNFGVQMFDAVNGKLLHEFIFDICFFE